MQDFFNGNDAENQPEQNYNPPSLEPTQTNNTDHPQHSQQNYEAPSLEFNSYPQGQANNFQFSNENADNEFNDFEEDEMTRRIREEEQRIQASLQEKSQKEWEEKNFRKEEGRRQLDQFINRKEEEKRQRAADNIRKEETLREDLKKLNLEAGWKKVISNINLRQGEYKGKKDINRMREAILHRREDDS